MRMSLKVHQPMWANVARNEELYEERLAEIADTRLSFGQCRANGDNCWSWLNMTQS